MCDRGGRSIWVLTHVPTSEVLSSVTYEHTHTYLYLRYIDGYGVPIEKRGIGLQSTKYCFSMKIE